MGLRTIPMKPQGIPAVLRALARWACWRWELEGEDRVQRWQAKVGCPFDEAVASASASGHDGIGLGLAGDGYSAVVLSDCYDSKTGDITPEAVEVILQLDSYSEVHASARGVVVWARGHLPDALVSRDGLQVLADGQFLPVTGWHLPRMPDTVEARQPELLRLFHRLRGTAVLTDEDLLSRARTAKNGEKFARLWEGDPSSFRSESEADLALCGILAFWAQGDHQRVVNLFGQSGLAKREKWQNADYRQRTVNQALAGLPKFYQPRGKPVFTMSRLENNCGADGVDDRKSLNLELTAEQLEQARTMALDIAGVYGILPDWDVSFRLARRLKRLGQYRPEQFKDAVAAFCEQTGRKDNDAESFLYEFIVAWEMAKTADGENPVEWAANRAKEQPCNIPCSPSPLYESLASLAWHLSQFTKGKPFWLSQTDLAGIYGKSQMTISRALKILVKNGILRCVSNYQRPMPGKKGKAKEYVFTGPAPEGTPDVEQADPPPTDDEPPVVEKDETRRKTRLAEKQSKSSPFSSRHGDRWLSPAHWLAEEMCIRQAAHQKTELPFNYYYKPKWESEFRRQTTLARFLLDKYTLEVILAVVRRPTMKRVYSLVHDIIDDKCLGEQERQALREIDAQEGPLVPPTEPFVAPATPRPVFTQEKTLLSRLRNL